MHCRMQTLILHLNSSLGIKKQNQHETNEKKKCQTFSLYIFFSLPASSSMGRSRFWSSSHMLPLFVTSPSDSDAIDIFSPQRQFLRKGNCPTNRYSDSAAVWSLTLEIQTQISSSASLHSIIASKQDWSQRQDFQPNLPTKQLCVPRRTSSTALVFARNEDGIFGSTAKRWEITTNSQHRPKSICRNGPRVPVATNNLTKNATFRPEDLNKSNFGAAGAKTAPNRRSTRDAQGNEEDEEEEEEEEDLRWRLEESAAVPTVAEQKKASNIARSSRCLGTARRRGSQAGGAPPRIRPGNKWQKAPALGYEWLQVSHYLQTRRTEEEHDSEGGRESKEEVLRFLQLTSCLRLVFYGCSVDRTVESADVGTMTWQITVLVI